jgi:phosphoenolpyruvate-protein kinase (PTS system EI component)
MFPMVATLGEVRTARRILQQCAAELRSEGHSIAADIDVGIMIETPAAAMIADQLAGEVDFFSIGTNDLSQYALAADRTNPATGELASAFQPSVLRLIAHVAAAAHARGKRVAVCGELGGEALAIPILIGLGVDELSMSAPAIPAASDPALAGTCRHARGRGEALERSPDVSGARERGSPTIVWTRGLWRDGPARFRYASPPAGSVSIQPGMEKCDDRRKMLFTMP